jgi:hypothetical protein
MSKKRPVKKKVARKRPPKKPVVKVSPIKWNIPRWAVRAVGVKCKDCPGYDTDYQIYDANRHVATFRVEALARAYVLAMNALS